MATFPVSSFSLGKLSLKSKRFCEQMQKYVKEELDSKPDALDIFMVFHNLCRKQKSFCKSTV